MQEFSGIVFSYLSPTWTRSHVKDRIAPRCNLSSPSHSRCPTSCRSVSQGRNPSCSRISSHTTSPAGTRSS